MILCYFKGHPEEHQPIIAFYQSLIHDSDEPYPTIGRAMSALIQTLEQTIVNLPSEVTVGTSMMNLTFFHPSQNALLVKYTQHQYVIILVIEEESRDVYTDDVQEATHIIRNFLEEIARKSNRLQ